MVEHFCPLSRNAGEGWGEGRRGRVPAGGPPPPVPVSEARIERKGDPMDPRVGILMGSDSDLEIMEEAAQVCEEFGVTYEIHVLSAHRTPQDTADYARHAHQRWLKGTIAVPCAATHLAGEVAGFTPC